METQTDGSGQVAGNTVKHLLFYSAVGRRQDGAPRVQAVVDTVDLDDAHGHGAQDIVLFQKSKKAETDRLTAPVIPDPHLAILQQDFLGLIGTSLFPDPNIAGLDSTSCCEVIGGHADASVPRFDGHGMTGDHLTQPGQAADPGPVLPYLVIDRLDQVVELVPEIPNVLDSTHAPHHFIPCAAFKGTIPCFPSQPAPPPNTALPLGSGRRRAGEQ